MKASDGEDNSSTAIDPDDTASVDDLPHGDDVTRATPRKGTTAGLGDAEADEETVPPAKPMDLTAEAASDTNALAESVRGVFLTWNEVEDADTETVSYRIARIRMNTGVDALKQRRRRLAVPDARQ